MEEIKEVVESSEVKVSISAPWITYFKIVYNVLSVDTEISMPDEVTDEGDGVYSFYIESPNASKIIALSKVLKNEVIMGNITLKVDYRCTNDASIQLNNENITSKDFETAFHGNKYFVRVENVKVPGGAFSYAIFTRDIITFYNDDLSDYHQNAHYIVADIIRDIIDPCNVYPCTIYE